jgi:hypothetical protein
MHIKNNSESILPVRMPVDKKIGEMHITEANTKKIAL